MSLTIIDQSDILCSLRDCLEGSSANVDGLRLQPCRAIFFLGRQALLRLYFCSWFWHDLSLQYFFLDDCNILAFSAPEMAWPLVKTITSLCLCCLFFTSRQQWCHCAGLISSIYQISDREISLINHQLQCDATREEKQTVCPIIGLFATSSSVTVGWYCWIMFDPWWELLHDILY